jgi:hypothetical protein
LTHQCGAALEVGVKPTALDLYKLYYDVKEMLDDLRESAREYGEWGAVRSLDSATYYLFGAASWLVQDLSPEEREELEAQLEALDSTT